MRGGFCRSARSRERTWRRRSQHYGEFFTNIPTLPANFVPCGPSTRSGATNTDNLKALISSDVELELRIWAVRLLSHEWNWDSRRDDTFFDDFVEKPIRDPRLMMEFASAFQRLNRSSAALDASFLVFDPDAKKDALPLQLMLWYAMEPEVSTGAPEAVFWAAGAGDLPLIRRNIVRRLTEVGDELPEMQAGLKALMDLLGRTPTYLLSKVVRSTQRFLGTSVAIYFPACARHTAAESRPRSPRVGTQPYRD